MNQRILALFPPKTHRLSLVSDPDHLLAGEMVMTELTGRGFQIIQESDPILLRDRVESVRPFSSEHPLIIITAGSLEDLPYDLYQPAHKIKLSLHQYFPNLAYPVLQTLSPDKIEILESCRQPEQILSRQKTIDYLLKEVFAADPIDLRHPHKLIAWLNDYHHRQSQLPDLLRTNLTNRLKQSPEYQKWDVDLIFRDVQAFQDFVQGEWQKSVYESLNGEIIKEPLAVYSIPFHQDPRLQDLVPGLVRRGMIQPMRVVDQLNLPGWVRPGVSVTDARLDRLAILKDIVAEQLERLKSTPEKQAKWNDWMDLAQDWAELCSIHGQSGLNVGPDQKETFDKLATKIDLLFSIWLERTYSVKGTQRLPKPHHVHHVPHYLAYKRDAGQLDKVVLFVLDGLSLSDWVIIQSTWKKRHTNWSMKFTPLLAQVPTITSISRFALISGMRPVDFLNYTESNLTEARAWQLFWSREGVAENTCKLLPLSYDRQIDQLPELQDPRINFWCLIDDTPDKLAHNATLGAADQQASLRLWLDPAQGVNSLPLENLIDWFLDDGFSVYIASDHGHVEATGFGQPSEGLLVQTRGKRARIYNDHLAAKRVQESFSETILWENDGLLPSTLSVLMPEMRKAFTYSGDVVVTHGGITVEEVVVPFVNVTKESSING